MDNLTFLSPFRPPCFPRLAPPSSRRCPRRRAKLVPYAAAPVFAAGESRQTEVASAVREAVASASAPFVRADVCATIAFLFVQTCAEETASNEMRRVVEVARRTLAFRRILSPSTYLLGCTSGSFSTSPSDAVVSVALLHLPDGTRIHPFRIPAVKELDIDAPQQAWWQLIGLSDKDALQEESIDEKPRDALQFVVFQHPDYERTLDLLAGLDFGFPLSPKVGAVAGQMNALHEAYVFDNQGAHSDGVVGVAISSDDVRVNVMLAQGARGVGPLMEVTEVRGSTEVTKAREIDTPTQAEAAPMQLLDMWDHTEMISEADRQLARKYLLFGIEVETMADRMVTEKELGVEDKGRNNVEADMVVRKVVGFNEATRSLAVEGSAVRLGSRARFQVRDEKSARDELGVLFDRQGLEGVTNSMNGLKLIGGIVMADTERGVNLYGDVESDTDRRLFKERFRVPVSSLGCAGQMGPLPAPGFECHFPIRGVGFAASTFTHSSSALYVLFYGRFPSSSLDASAGDREER